MFDTPLPLSNIWLPDPVYRNHPLNRRRVAWWMALPGLGGGRQWFDLMGLYPGTLGAAASWGTGRDDSSASVVMGGGSTSPVDCGSPFTATTANLTIAAWIFRTTSGATLTFGWGNTNNFRFNVLLLGTTLYTQVENGGNNYSSVACSIVGWHRILLSYDGANNGASTYPAIYIDGIVQVLGAGNGNPSTYAPTGNFWIGAETANSNYSTGRFSDVSIWNRSLSAADALADYDLSRRGYPGVLRRPAPLINVPSGGPPTYSGSGTPALSSLTASSSVSYTAPVVSGTGTPTLSALVATASVAYVAPVVSGSGTPSLSALTATAVVSYVAVGQSGSGTPSLSVLTASASVSYTNPIYSGTGAPAFSVLTASASVSYTAPVVSGAGTPSLSNLTASAVVSYVAVGQAGSGTPSLSALTAIASVSYTTPVYSGTGTPSLSALTAIASVSYTIVVIATVGYFPTTYFESTYFAPTYFPGGEFGPPPVFVDTLAEAIRVRLLAGVPVLTDVYRRETPGKTAAGISPVTPYCIVNVLGESPEWVTGPNLYPGWLDVQFTFVSMFDVEAESIRDAAYRLFTPRRELDGSSSNGPLISIDGTIPAFGTLPGRKTEYKNPGKGPFGQPLWLFQFTMRCYVTREM